MADSNDTLVRVDPKSQELAYNNTTDRIKVELPLDTTGLGFGGKYRELSPNTTANVIWTPVSGKKYIITDFIFSSQTEGNLKLYDGTGDPSHTLMKLVVASGVTVGQSFRTPYPSSAIDTTLYADCNPGCSGYLAVWGYEL